jgi:hypothetical protein
MTASLIQYARLSGQDCQRKTSDHSRDPLFGMQVCQRQTTMTQRDYRIHIRRLAQNFTKRITIMVWMKISDTTPYSTLSEHYDTIF